MRVLIKWMPGEPGCVSTSTRDEAGLRDLFGGAEATRIIEALRLAGGAVTLTVNGHDAGYMERDLVEAEFVEVR